MSIKMRQMVEREIVTVLVDSILSNGKRIAVSLERGFDTDDMLLGSTDNVAILEAAMAGDDCHLFVQPATGPTLECGRTRVVSEGWVYLVFGNDGWDVISDYTTNLEYLMGPVNAVIEKYEDGVTL